VFLYTANNYFHVFFARRQSWASVKSSNNGSSNIFLFEKAVLTGPNGSSQSLISSISTFFSLYVNGTMLKVFPFHLKGTVQ
jgi:hypothetical protein